MRHSHHLIVPSLLLAMVASAVEVPFAPPKDIGGGSVSGVSSTDAGRIDNDALVDVVLVEGGMHAGGRKTLAWFKSPVDPQGAWTRNNISTAAPLKRFLGSAKLADMDNDGDQDLVVSSDMHSGTTIAADVFVLLNPGGAATGTWSYHKLNPSTLALHHINDMAISDIDGDGKKEVIVRSLEPNQIHIFFQNSISSWTRRTLDTGIAQSEGLAVGRIDGDGHPDISFTGWWFRTPTDARNGTYNKLPIDSGYQSVNQNTKEDLGDIDGDGWLDIVIGPAEAYRDGGNHVLAWYRNPGAGWTANWTRHVIRSGTNNHHTVKLGDMDGDGRLDVVTAKPWSASGIPMETLIFFNDGSGGFAQVQKVSATKGLYAGVVADIGNDGDLDIIGPELYASTGKPLLYESTRSSTAPPDTTPPSAPGSFLASASGPTAIGLSWTAATDNVGVTGYVISRSGAADVPVTGTSATISGLNSATTYTFTVRARDAAGNLSTAATASATTAVAPATPSAFARIEAEAFVAQSGLGIYSGGSGQKIGSIENNTWARYTLDFAAGVSTCQFRAASATSGGTIELRLGSTTGTLIGSCAVPGTGGWNNFVDLSCSVNGVSGAQQLYLVFKGGSGALLDVDWFQFTAGAPADTTAPTVPGNLQATASGSTGMTLSWSAATDNVGVTGYEISRAGTVIATVTGTSHVDGGLAAATTYAYAVRARDAAGNWSAAATASGTTAAAPTAPDAFARVEAESFVAQSGLGIYSGGSGQKIGSIENNTWARYTLDFGTGASTCQFRAASATSGGTIELRLGSTTGTLIGSCVVPGTGGWNNFVDLSCPVDGVSGVQQLYLVFKGGSGALLDVDWFQFTTAVPTAPDAFARVEAESFAAQSGLGIYSGGSGQKIGSIENNTWARYTLDFAVGASACQFRAASNTSGGTIELRLGSTTGTLIGSCVVPGTGGWNNFVDLSCPVDGVSGVQQLYLVFKGGSGALLDVDWFEFTPVVPGGNG